MSTPPKSKTNPRQTAGKIAAIEIRRMPLADLQPHPRNPRQHPDPGTPEWNALKDSLTHDYFDPIVWNRRNQLLVSGHLRTKVLTAEGFTHADVSVVDYDEPTHLARLLSANKLQGADDQAQVAKLLHELGPLNLDGLTGFTEAEIKQLLDNAGLGAPPVEAEPQIDRAAELQKEWKTKPGQLWQLGDHRLLCGDCTKPDDVKRVMGGGMASGIFTSPPYAEQRKNQYGGIPADKYVEWWAGVQSVCGAFLAGDGSFFFNIKTHAIGVGISIYVHELVIAMVKLWGWHLHDEFCWERQGMPGDPVRMHKFKNQWELVCWFSKSDKPVFRPRNVMHASDSAILDTNYVTGLETHQGTTDAMGDNRIKGEGYAYPGNRIPVGRSEALGHPAAFPVDLPTFFVKAFSDESNVWLEPFCGSGTTLIACENLQRKCRAIEISPAYVAVALQRWAEATGKQPKTLK